MRWANFYFLGFVVFLGGVVAAAWKIGLVERVGAAWTAIGVVMALGIGIMVSVASSGRKESIQIEK
jgi:hypothetical protein